MSEIKVIEGEVSIEIPGAGKPCKTWYKIFGDLKSGVRPLVGVHGGPGVPHNYLLALSDLATSHGIPLVLYDQVGAGQSTHLPEKMGDITFWTEELFLNELDNLLQHLGIQEDYALLGHSWGGMLIARHATRQPKGLKRLVLQSSPSDMGLWVEATNKLRLNLPQDVQDTLKKHEDAGTTESKEYQDAVTVFYQHYVCRLNVWPENLVASLALLEKDPTVYFTMNGPSEFHITGPLKHWTIVKDAHKINVPTLLLNGRYDEAQDSVVEPYFREIPKIKWVTFAESSHMAHEEERERFMQVVGSFLTS
ncbi:hypothetical protein BZG36_05736 [Bifiguratus adelaidae]|uniref:AB hydrolase-1 domain-containing protein n=1 Tax=Bifiguratus adelaidae TaxID=1938954 RepID=A0A261XSM4_9FUNG|nr:hypothetical protein BZG36_05736 [Bifiguratus adelaidae]